MDIIILNNERDPNFLEITLFTYRQSRKRQLQLSNYLSYIEYQRRMSYWNKILDKNNELIQILSSLTFSV